MTEPVFSEAVELMYERLPLHIREADALQPYPVQKLEHPELTNLITNPSMETASGTTVVRTNLVHNPSVEAVMASYSYRSNLVPNPSAEVDVAGWQENGGGTTTRDTTQAWVGLACFKVTAPYSTLIFQVPTGNLISILSGRQYTASAYVKAGAAGRTGYAMIEWYDAANAVVSSTIGTVTALSDTGWTRISVAGFVPTGATKAKPRFRVDTVVINTESTYFDGIMFEEGQGPWEYFDGTTAADSIFTHSWAGTAHNSVSRKMAPQVASFGENGVRKFVTAPGLGLFGSAAMLVSPTVNGDARSIMPTPRPTVTAGRKYTFSFHAKLWNGVGSAADLYCSANGSGTSGGSFSSSVAQDVGNGWYRISAVYTCTTTGELWAQVSGPTSVMYSAEFLFDGFMMEESDVLLPYFDGSTAATNDFTYAWAGTANASNSEQRAPALPGATVYVSVNVGVVHQSSEQARFGSKSAKFLFPTAATQGEGAWSITVAGLTVGRQYTVSEWVYVPTGSPDVNVRVGGHSEGAWTSVKDQWTRITHTWTATATSHTLYLARNRTATTRGNDICYVDGAMLNEGDVVYDYFDGDTNPVNYIGLADDPYWTGTPHASTSVLPEITDGASGYPLKRWLAGVGNVFGEVATLIDRFDYTTPGDGGIVGDTSDLVDPVTADEAWLNWLARLVGYRNIDNRPAAEKRSLIGSGSAFNKGSKASVMAAAASVLTGSKRVTVYDHTTDTSPLGTATMWDVCIVTTVDETPSAQAVIDAVVNSDAKPAGVKLWHRFYEATWDTIEAQNPTWDAIDAKTWDKLQESGI